jgi:hypothetical protein
VFDQSNNKPFSFILGGGGVIAGFDQGYAHVFFYVSLFVHSLTHSLTHSFSRWLIGMDSVTGMCVHEKRQVVIPPALGYGHRGTKSIPGDATLDFEIELLAIQDPTKVRKRPNVFRDMDRNNDGAITYEEMQYWFEHSHPDRLPTIPRGVWERDDKNMVSTDLLMIVVAD